MFLFKDIITPDVCRRHTEFLYVYGDNLKHTGTGGQAIIRDEPNSFGIPTKHEPTRSPAAYFSDRSDEVSVVERYLKELDEMSDGGRVIVLPTNPVGTGLAKLDEWSPKIAKMIRDWWSSKPRLYTSNFASIKKDRSIRVIPITRFTPKWIDCEFEMKELSPKSLTLLKYKKGEINDKEYIYAFDDVLRELLPLNVIETCIDKDSAFTCFCGKGAFCHRHLVAEWIERELDIIINEFGYEKTKRKLGKLSR
jgi:hypothetical protein